MTTFTDLTSLSVTLTGSAVLKPSGASSARATGTGTLLAVPSTITADGHIRRDLSANLSGSGNLAATVIRRVPFSATLEGSAALRQGQGGTVRWPSLVSQGADRNYAASRASFPALTTQGEAAPALPNYAFSSALLPALRSQGADRNYAASRTTFPALITAGHDGDGPTAATSDSYLFAYTTLSAEQTLQRGWTDAMAMSDTQSLARLRDGQVSSGMTLAAAVSAVGTFSQSMRQTLQWIDAALRDDATLAWVVNTESRDYRGNPIYPSSRYESFGFTSFMQWQGRYFGAKEGGIFELIGDNDAGEQIVSQITLNQDDYGSPFVKRMQYVYAGVSTRTAMSVTVRTDDNQRYTYVLAENAALQTARAVLGRGLRARWWQLTLTNPDGGDFTLVNAETHAELTDRRLL